MDSLATVVEDIRDFMYGGIITLPLTIAGTMLIIGLFTANYAILFFLVGFLIITPFFSSVFDLVLTSIFDNSFKVTTSDICKINVPYSYLGTPHPPTQEGVACSSWVAMVSFLIGYMFTNGIKIYNRESDKDTVTLNENSKKMDSKVTNRKSHAIISMASIVIFIIVSLGYRYYTGCESGIGMIITSLLFSSLGYGWYIALSAVGQDRLSDIFGIANRLLPKSAVANKPIACVPIKT